MASLLPNCFHSFFFSNKSSSTSGTTVASPARVSSSSSFQHRKHKIRSASDKQKKSKASIYLFIQIWFCSFVHNLIPPVFFVLSCDRSSSSSLTPEAFPPPRLSGCHGRDGRAKHLRHGLASYSLAVARPCDVHSPQFSSLPQSSWHQPHSTRKESHIFCTGP